jgi:hypothetical protein
MNLPARIADWPKRWRELYEERAALIEYQANLLRSTAAFRAEVDTRRQAANEKREERTA